jgi:hypothetical protein
MKKSDDKYRGLKNAGLVTLGVGLGIGIVGKLYNDLVKDYNNLTEKTNRFADFINTHDFYEPVKPDPKTTPKEKRYYSEEIVDEESGVKTKVFTDTISGLKLYTVKKSG